MFTHISQAHLSHSHLLLSVCVGSLLPAGKSSFPFNVDHCSTWWLYVVKVLDYQCNDEPPHRVFYKRCNALELSRHSDKIIFKT